MIGNASNAFIIIGLFKKKYTIQLIIFIIYTVILIITTQIKVWLKS